MERKIDAGGRCIDVLSWISAGFLSCMWISLLILDLSYDTTLFLKAHIVALVTFAINYDTKFNLKNVNPGTDDKIGCKY
ncbi:hypothetical protein [Dyadobacter psychrotolerans]|jgi:DNA-binding CsgD family transcriptional regulator|uniref:Uncharacterized protein n=1 Tax=Dyadobacter psychrotolerans TaxID=2541721 RepID=A0A4R5DH48_9BACT|nr:hypothetical protein [Dyadobacter psychrotolerans]TDE09793.1 hypothetical protein E0F88_29830 [Dyadobacter psychrotolerans]